MEDENRQGIKGRICIDACILIGLTKNEDEAEQLLAKNADSEIFISSVTAYEMLLRETKHEIEDFLSRIRQLPFGEREAKTASTINMLLRKKGAPIQVQDLFIAATAIANNCTLATFNRKNFEEMDGLNLLEF
ncbi:type II toxin-antitoxin system VapC family toxin [Candidatus Woesearchaeota archaeon]|nr:type II toxin-antitoxin system VapC family toxin [Candidatus Woesearchaeota archaeon]